ncbi:MAG: TetR/AcrR family transcriptional regulator [Clostridiaceae bacterium]
MDDNAKKNKKNIIIESAIKVFTEKSVEEATVREIAANAGLTTGAIYYYYKNKDELLLDVMNHSIHFIHKISEMHETKLKKQQDLLLEIEHQIANRLLKIEEQKLSILLISDVISKDGPRKEKYKENYESIINKVADLYYYAFDIENEKLKKSMASILVASLDGLAIQQSLGVLPESEENFIKIFTDFFYESIPLFLQQHMENNI